MAMKAPNTKSPERIAYELRVSPTEVRVAAAELNMEPAAVRIYPRFDAQQAQRIAEHLQHQGTER